MIQIGKKDILWNYGATFLKIASSVLLFPFILRTMPTEMVGIWTIFMTITTFSVLLDFGFNPSFVRNVTYVFSGVRSLKVNGFEQVSIDNRMIDYGLLKGVIVAMQWIYLRMAAVLFLVLTTFGTWYVYLLLKNYKGDPQEVYIAWIILCAINIYNLYTLYYDSLLQGKGLIKKSKQIVIIGQIVYLLIASFLLLAGCGLIAIISAQASSVIIIRWLSYNAFFTPNIEEQLDKVLERPLKEVLVAIYPNAFKIGLTSLGGFMVQRSAIIIGSLYLSLEDIASYGITMQMIAIVNSLAGIYVATYQPKISQLRVENNNLGIKELYLRGQIVLLLTYVIGGVGILILGEWGMKLIGSQTQLMATTLIFVAIIVSFLEDNHAIAGGIILTKNEVPFFKASLFSGSATVILLLLLFKCTNLGLWAMICAPGIAQLAYQNWKWPLVVINELEVTRKDITISIANIFNKVVK